VVIQNSQQSKLVYGADVSGTVFKEISDKIYGHFLSTAKVNFTHAADTSAYSYYGLKAELNSVLSTMNLARNDAAGRSKWAMALVKNEQAQYSSPTGNLQTGSITPDVRGMGLKDAVDVLENLGFRVTVRGRGKVMNQSVMAGTPFKKGQSVSLVLN
jgi:cell division protein FtsI (penicillin-binding protein 3)